MAKTKHFRWELIILPVVMITILHLLTSYMVADTHRGIEQNSLNLRLSFLGVSLLVLAILDMGTLTVCQSDFSSLISLASLFGGVTLFVTAVATKIAGASLLGNFHFVRTTDIMEISATLFLLSSVFLFFRVLNKSRVAENEVAVVDWVAWYPGEVFSLNPLFSHEIIKIKKENLIDGVAKLKFKDGGEYKVGLCAVAILEIPRANFSQPFLKGTENLKVNLKNNLAVWLTGVIQRQAQEMTLGEFFAAKQLQPTETMIYDLPFTWDGKLSRTISA